MSNIEIELLIKETNRKFNVDLLSNCRKRINVFLRAIIINKIYKSTNKTLVEIGACFNRNHATIIHAFKVYELNKDYDDFKELLRKMNSINLEQSQFCKPCYYESIR